MDKRKDAERVRLERARQEDAALNRVLIIIVGAVVLEAILFLLNRFYVSYTIDDIARVQAILAAVKVLLVAFPICFVGSLVWLLAARKNGRRMLLPGICTGSFAALSICAVAARFFRESGIPALCVLVPALAAQAALRAGEATRIVGAARLRIKESDRLDTVCTELGRLGAEIRQGPDFLELRGVEALRGGAADSHNDHRIAMMLAVAACRAAGPVTVTGAGCVAKSYPNFWEDYERLGGQIRREG